MKLHRSPQLCRSRAIATSVPWPSKRNSLPKSSCSGALTPAARRAARTALSSSSNASPGSGARAQTLCALQARTTPATEHSSVMASAV